jgi:diguanylate cyclase (GGDEF)-like protein/PAS domain S-box-containing protein
MRLSIGLSCLTMSVLLAAESLGLVPDRDGAVMAGRKSLSEAVAVQCCLAAQHDDVATMRTIMQALVSRNDAVLSAAVRRVDGKVLVEIGPHLKNWHIATDGKSTADDVLVPILYGKGKTWGAVEIRFQPLATGWLSDWFGSTGLSLIVFVAGAGFLIYTSYLKKMLQYLDPSSVIPERVRETLDTLVEGVVVLDKEQRIVLANKAFARNTGHTTDELQGSRVPDIRWSRRGEAGTDAYPWERSIRDGEAQTGVMLELDSKIEGLRTFMVNSMPILGGDGKRRGALATFDDVTNIERKNLQLEQMLASLKESRDEIRRQNDELQLLATRDPLTACLNRRAFFHQFELQWTVLTTQGRDLVCIMADIDHFKSVNDNHGHSTGDQVLQQISALIRSSVREDDLVCRYGGEEFCILLPGAEIQAGLQFAERLRAAIAAQPCVGLTITASLGVTSLGAGSEKPRDLIDQADKALYASKRGGRNRVTNWHDLPADFEIEKGTTERRKSVAPIEVDVPIPFHAVTALSSALAFRDPLTAEHSRRVADLCVLTARGLMPERECYVLEVAALLHDIGKLGVPDAILLKPGPLTPEEWKVMSTHDRIGVEIITAAFSSAELTEIVRTHHSWYGGNPRDPSLPRGTDIPLPARILTISDAFDAMVSDRVYRKGRTREAAFAELRNCAGRQFDHDLVERFIEAVSANDVSRSTPQLAVSKQAALRIGLQIERLASALDAQDYPDLSAMAGRLAATAAKEGVSEIADLAGQLEESAASDPDLLTVVKLTTDLLELCRSTQTSYLAVGDASEE